MEMTKMERRHVTDEAMSLLSEANESRNIGRQRTYLWKARSRIARVLKAIKDKTSGKASI